MLNKRFKTLTFVFMTTALALPELSIPAEAVPPAQIGAIDISDLHLDNSNLLTEVGYKYDRRYHGNRYRYRRNGYNNYYGGYYYATPWWALPGLVAPWGVYNYGEYDDYEYGYGGHVEWCLNRYRSYNPRTDTFVGYDGYRHRCYSPYD